MEWGKENGRKRKGEGIVSLLFMSENGVGMCKIKSGQVNPGLPCHREHDTHACCPLAMHRPIINRCPEGQRW